MSAEKIPKCKDGEPEITQEVSRLLREGLHILMHDRVTRQANVFFYNSNIKVQFIQIKLQVLT